MQKNTKTTLLRDLFQATYAAPHCVSRRGFLAKHSDDVNEIEKLIALGEIQHSDGQHLRLPLLGLNELARAMPEAESVLFLCGHLFDVLRSAFIDRPDELFSQSEIAALADMPEGRVARALGYLMDAPIFDGWSIGADGFRSQIQISDRILKYQTFADLVDAMPARSKAEQLQEVRHVEEGVRAVYGAIEQLIANGKRAYVRSVPRAAENLLVQWSKGRLGRVDASTEIRAAIHRLAQEGKIEAPLEQYADWVIKVPLLPGVSDATKGVSAEEVEGVEGAAMHSYVDPARLHEIKSVSSEKWDLKRLLRMCEELNSAFEQKSFIACSMLVRGIVDHVPPIFGCSTFSEVGSNYPGSRSFRASMRHLDQSLRNLADGNLHTQIRRTESLPTEAQVRFWADLDKLLEEVVRILNDQRSR